MGIPVVPRTPPCVGTERQKSARVGRIERGWRCSIGRPHAGLPRSFRVTNPVWSTGPGGRIDMHDRRAVQHFARDKLDSAKLLHKARSRHSALSVAEQDTTSHLRRGSAHNPAANCLSYISAHEDPYRPPPHPEITRKLRPSTSGTPPPMSYSGFQECTQRRRTGRRRSQIPRGGTCHPHSRAGRSDTRVYRIVPHRHAKADPRALLSRITRIGTSSSRAGATCRATSQHTHEPPGSASAGRSSSFHIRHSKSARPKGDVSTRVSTHPRSGGCSRRDFHERGHQGGRST